MFPLGVAFKVGCNACAAPCLNNLLTGENTLTIDHDRFVVVDRNGELFIGHYFYDDPSLD